jgi:cytochrome c oxidase assembly factor CtaG
LHQKLNNFIFTPFTDVDGVMRICGFKIKQLYCYYTQPPAGVPVEQAEKGSMIMYYGGDLIDAVLIFILCHQWFKSARPVTSAKAAHSADSLTMITQEMD